MMTQTEPSSSYEPELVFGNAPNLLTLVRILLVPFLVAMLFQRTQEWDIAAALVFAAASITDYFDGYLARRRNQVTVYGKLMDPLADKFLVVSALIMLQHLDRIHPAIVILLICRELAITGLRALASAEGVVIAASASAKWKTATQMVAIPFIMVNPGIFGIPLYTIGQWLLYVSLFISLGSALQYIRDFFRLFHAARKERATRRREHKYGRRAGDLPS